MRRRLAGVAFGLQQKGVIGKGWRWKASSCRTPPIIRIGRSQIAYYGPAPNTLV
jgi:hypothetical protein